MLVIHTQNLENYLIQTHNLRVLTMIDLDVIMQQPRRTLYALFLEHRLPVFEPQDRIVLFSRQLVPVDVLIHVQQCAAKIDISNSFIMLVSPSTDNTLLDQIRRRWSTDNNIFVTLNAQLSDSASIDRRVSPQLNLPESFCFSPWAHLEISSRGEFRPCCVYKEPVVDDTERAFNINTDTIASVYTSRYLQNLRRQFLAGDRPNACAHCWNQEQLTGHSNRTWLLSQLGIKADLLEIESLDSLANVISLDIKLGNTCNFKCRICGPESSSKIAEEISRNFKDKISIKTLNKQGRWIENKHIWWMLEDLGKQLVNIDFFGGEPFLIKQQENFIDYLSQLGTASSIRLHYNTNGSIYPDHLFVKWEQFREVDIAFSIDNLGSRFEYERGGNWEQVERNIDRMLDSRLSNMKLSIFPTLNLQNIYYLPELIDWAENRNFDSINLNLLDTPKYLSIMHMESELTDLVVKKLSKIDIKRQIKHNINNIIKLLTRETKRGDYMNQTRDYMLRLDRIRNQNFANSHKEIADIVYKGREN